MPRRTRASWRIGTRDRLFWILEFGETTFFITQFLAINETWHGAALFILLLLRL